MLIGKDGCTVENKLAKLARKVADEFEAHKNENNEPLHVRLRMVRIIRSCEELEHMLLYGEGPQELKTFKGDRDRLY